MSRDDPWKRTGPEGGQCSAPGISPGKGPGRAGGLPASLPTPRTASYRAADRSAYPTLVPVSWTLPRTPGSSALKGPASMVRGLRSPGVSGAFRSSAPDQGPAPWTLGELARWTGRHSKQRRCPAFSRGLWLTSSPSSAFLRCSTGQVQNQLLLHLIKA